MIELKRLKLINWHNFENTTFDCARLTYMIGVNAVGKTTILDAIRYCLTTNRNFNALGNKKSGRTLQGSVHAKQRGENAYRRPGHTVAYIGAEFWDSVKHTSFVIAVRVESEGPMQELHPGDQTWYISEDGITLEQLPFIDPRTGAPSAKEDFKPAEGRLSYTRSPSEARDRICRALGIGRAASPLGKKFNEVFQMGTSMDEIPNFREFLYQYILPQPELDLEALQGDRLELENLHAVLAEAQTRADALDEIVRYGREATEKQTEALVNRGAALLARAAADAGEKAVWQERVDAGRRQQETLRTRYAEAKTAEAEARRAYLTAHSAAGASGEGRALDALNEELAHRQTALDAAARRADTAEKAAEKTGNLLAVLRRSGFAAGQKLADLTPDTLPALTDWLTAQEKPLEEAYFAARQHTAALQRQQTEKRAELDAVSGGKWVYPHGDAATRVRDAVNAELKSRGMEPDARVFCELLNVEDESWQDCVEACLGDRRFDILVPPAHYAAAKSAFVALKDKVGPISLLDTPGLRKANRRADTAPADSLAAQVTSENPLAAQYADTILRRIVCCDTPDTLENYPDSATRDLLRHHPFRLERLRTPQRYIGLEARRARAGALAGEMNALAEEVRAAAQAEQNLKAAYSQYQTLLRGTTLEELAALWDARAALTAARAAVDEQAAKLAECRENPLLQQLYKEEEVREAAWEAARTAVEQTGGDLRVCEKQISSCEAEQQKAVDTAEKSAQAAESFFAAHPLVEPLSRSRQQALTGPDKSPRAAAQAADDAAEAAGKSASVEDFTRAATQLFDASAVEEAVAEKAARKTDKKRRRKAEKPESGPVQPSIKNRSLEIIEKSERRRRRTVILGLVVLTLVLVLGGGALWLFLRCDLGARPAAKSYGTALYDTTAESYLGKALERRPGVVGYLGWPGLDGALVYAADTPDPETPESGEAPSIVRFATPSALDAATPGNTVVECTGSDYKALADEDTLKQNSGFTLYTAGNVYRFKAIAVYYFDPSEQGAGAFDLYGSTDLSSYYDYLTFVAGIQARSLFDTGVDVGDDSRFLTVTTHSDESGVLLCITGRLIREGEAELLNTSAIAAAEEPLLTAAQYERKGQPMPTVSTLVQASVDRYAQQSTAAQAARKNGGTGSDTAADTADLAQRADDLQAITDSLLASTDKMLKGLTDVAGSTNAVETDLNKGAEGSLPEQTVTVDQIKTSATPEPTATSAPTEPPADSAAGETTTEPTAAPTEAPQPDNSGTGETINVTMNGTAQTMDLVQCLAMVAQNELGPNAPAEAYKAQCVATHCWIISQSGYPSVLGADPGAAALAAAQEVAHVLVTYNGQVCFTPYFASASTGTASAAEVWGNDRAWLQAVDSPYDQSVSSHWNTNGNSSGTARFSRQTLQDRIRDVMDIDLSGVDPNSWFTIQSANQYGWVAKIQVGPDAGVGTVSGRWFRENLLARQSVDGRSLRSQCFTVSYNADLDCFIFDVYGYGHGCGMSQWGAIGYARNGWGYQDILTHYFVGTTITTY